MDIVLGLVLYFGSLLLALLLLASGPGRRRPRLLLVGIGVQVLLSLLITWMTARIREAGYRDWFLANALHLPVNVLAGAYYLAVSFAPRRNASPSASQPTGRGR